MIDKAQQDVLIVNDESPSTRTVLAVLAGRGIRGTVARDAKTALAKLDGASWDLMFADLDLAGRQEYQLVRRARESQPDLPLVIVSDNGSVRPVVAAMRAGCEDCIVRPLKKEAVESVLDTYVPNHAVGVAAGEEGESRWQIAGRSDPLLEVVRLARKIAPTTVPVLLTGESGTGKELIAHLIHRHSTRCDAPYVKVNCASLSESLLESELFGHERGAFTGAVSQRKGRFERADGGTLLLDEISETGPRLQAQLLRVLEHQDFERVGGSEPIHADVRVICTSNRDLVAEVAKGRFRRDLYYRVCGVHLKIAALRERPDDVETLVWHFVNQYAGEVRRGIRRLDKNMLDALGRYSWPGNVRELRNVVRTALILGDGEALSLHGSQVLSPVRSGADRVESDSLSLQELERRAIFEALRRTKSHQAKAAHLLGITDRTLREKLRRYRQDELPEPAGESRWITEPA